MAVDKITVDKITWDRVGRVTEPGRYMYTFGWLTITAVEDGMDGIARRHHHTDRKSVV